MAAFHQGWLANLVLAAIASASLVLGAALPSLPVLRLHLFQHRLSLLIGFSSGIMLATALHELIPEALEQNPAHAMTGVAIGFLILYTAERVTHFHACRHRDCEVDDSELLHTHGENCAHEHDASHAHAAHEHIHHFDTMALVGMAIHNIADGLTLAAAFSVAPLVGVMVVLAIVLHQSAVGVSLGAIMLRAKRSHRRILWAASIVASFIIIGVVFYYVVVPVGAASRGVVLGLAAGSFLYVAACDLLPHAHADDEGWSVTACTLAGYAFVLLVAKLVVGS